MSDFAAGRVIPGNSDVLQVSYGDDSGLFVEFYYRPVKNEAKSLAAGYAIFEDKEYIKIIGAGNKNTTWDRPVKKVPDGATPSDLQRFPRQWQAFQNQKVQNVEGLPVNEWPGISPADAAMLKAQNIHTVEQMASIPDGNLTFAGARTYRDKAKTYLNNAKDSAFSVQLAEQNAKLQDQITALQNQLQGFINAGVMKQEASASPVQKKPGRPKKVKNEDIPSTDTASG